jgi:HK97 gp10 family phage protein
LAVKSNVDAVRAKIRAAAMIGVVRGAESVLEEATSLILDSPKTGRIYRRRGVEHQASAPGQAPASDTGRLAQSGRVTVGQTTVLDQANGKAVGRDVVVAAAQWSSAHASRLEHGTETMEPRPFARPALAAKRDEIVADIADEMRRVLKW